MKTFISPLIILLSLASYQIQAGCKQSDCDEMKHFSALKLTEEQKTAIQAIRTNSKKQLEDLSAEQKKLGTLRALDPLAKNYKKQVEQYTKASNVLQAKRIGIKANKRQSMYQQLTAEQQATLKKLEKKGKRHLNPCKKGKTCDHKGCKSNNDCKQGKCPKGRLCTHSKGDKQKAISQALGMDRKAENQCDGHKH